MYFLKLELFVFFTRMFLDKEFVSCTVMPMEAPTFSEIDRRPWTVRVT